MNGLLSSDITNYLYTLKEIRKLPIAIQEVVHEMTDIYLGDSEQSEREAAFYTILEGLGLP